MGEGRLILLARFFFFMVDTSSSDDSIEEFKRSTDLIPCVITKEFQEEIRVTV